MRSVAGSVVSHPYLHHLPVFSFMDIVTPKGIRLNFPIRKWLLFPPLGYNICKSITRRLTTFDSVQPIFTLMALLRQT